MTHSQLISHFNIITKYFFRCYISELDKQANAHEQLAQKIRKETARRINERILLVTQQEEMCKEQAENNEQVLCISLKHLADAKQGYENAENEREIVGKERKHDITCGNDPNEIESVNDALVAEALYKKQLIETNKDQREYYCKLLPENINRLQDIAVGNHKLVKDVIRKCMQDEKDVHKNIAKSVDALEKDVENMDDDNYSLQVIKR